MIHVLGQIVLVIVLFLAVVGGVLLVAIATTPSDPQREAERRIRVRRSEIERISRETQESIIREALRRAAYRDGEEPRGG